MNGYFVIRTYTAGSVGEKIKYWVSGQKPVRSKRRVSSEVNKLEKNEKQSEKNLARILNATFGKSGVLVGLDYSDKAYSQLFGKCKSREEIAEVAEHQLSLCLRRVQREAKKRGIEIVAVLTTADCDGETGEEVRVHHHVVVNEEAAELFGEKWKHGKDVDYEYLSRQKAYITTRNIKRAKCVDRIAKNDAEIALPRNCELLYRSAHVRGLSQYLRYRILEVRSDNPSVGKADSSLCTREPLKYEKRRR